MTPTQRDAEEWRYWRAVALTHDGDALQALPLFEALSEERSYYGFLAADVLKKSYALDAGPLTADEARLAELASNARHRARQGGCFLSGSTAAHVRNGMRRCAR